MKISKITRRLRFGQEDRRYKIDLTGPESAERSPDRPKPVWQEESRTIRATHSRQPSINPSVTKIGTMNVGEPATVREAFEIFKRNQETA